MSLILISNLSSWILVTLMWVLVHHHRASKGKYTNALAYAYAFTGLSLIVNSIIRILDETLYLVAIGGVVTKFSLCVVLTLVILHTHSRKENKDG